MKTKEAGLKDKQERWNYKDTDLYRIGYHEAKAEMQANYDNLLDDFRRCGEMTIRKALEEIRKIRDKSMEADQESCDIIIEKIKEIR